MFGLTLTYHINCLYTSRLILCYDAYMLRYIIGNNTHTCTLRGYFYLLLKCFVYKWYIIHSITCESSLYMRPLVCNNKIVGNIPNIINIIHVDFHMKRSHRESDYHIPPPLPVLHVNNDFSYNNVNGIINDYDYKQKLATAIEPLMRKIGIGSQLIIHKRT